MKLHKVYGGFFLLALAMTACIEPYDPPLDDRDVNFLVIDAYMDAQTGEATVSLSRSLPVRSVEAIPAESQATVRIEDGSGASYPLQETQAGVYTGIVLNPDSENAYRLMIQTGDRTEFASEFIEIVETPPIDSITWSAGDDGLEFAITTHDPANLVKHFRWEFVETYEYHSMYNSHYKFEGDDIVPRPQEESLYTCWRTIESTNILIGSARDLSQSVISKFPITFIPAGSIKISVKYSLLVRQQALTEKAYEYWTNLKKTTEHLGGLFDPLPSEVTGNIRCITDPRQTVLGFFSAGTVRQSRIFFRRAQLPRQLAGRFSNDPGCTMDTVLLQDLPQLHRSTLLIDQLLSPAGGFIGYTYSTVTPCADCTKSGGGVTAKPSFWE